MDDAGLPQLSEQLSEFSASPVEDIPEAVREMPGVLPQPALKRTTGRLWRVGGLGAIALVSCGLLVAFRHQLPFWAASSASSNQSTTEAATSASPSSGQTPSTAASDDASAPLLGHFPYKEAPQSELQTLPGSSEKLRRPAAEKFTAMVEAARAEGIHLVPLSGFRSVAEQEHVFFDVKAERGQTATTRADVSAPPGHSEHHTGYALDIGDADYPDTNLQIDFEKTKAFQWLQKNAAFYSFEMSFAKNNPMGVSYEPWHWRFVGDRDSLETFYRARSLTTLPASLATPAATPAPANPTEP